MIEYDISTLNWIHVAIKATATLQSLYNENWTTPVLQYNAICLSWARRIISEMPSWFSSSAPPLPSKQPHSLSFPAICLIAQYAPYEPATDWYVTLLKLAPMIPGILDQKIPPLHPHILSYMEVRCPVYGTPHKTKETQVLTLMSKEFQSLNHIQEICAKYAQNYLPNETPFRFTSCPKNIDNPLILSTYWGLQTIIETPIEPFTRTPKPNWAYVSANLTERFVAFATHTIAMREKFSKKPINFGKVSVLATTTKWLPSGLPVVQKKPFTIEMSTKKGVEITEFKPGTSSPRWAAIAKFTQT